MLFARRKRSISLNFDPLQYANQHCGSQVTLTKFVHAHEQPLISAVLNFVLSELCRLEFV